MPGSGFWKDRISMLECEAQPLSQKLSRVLYDRKEITIHLEIYPMKPDSHQQENNDRRQELRAEQEAFRLQQEEYSLETGKRRSTLTWIINSIYFLVGSLEVLLVLRFLLRLSGANTRNSVSQFIAMLSAPFVAPFSTLYVSPVTSDGANIFDLNVLIALIVYPLLGWLGVRLVRFVSTR